MAFVIESSTVLILILIIYKLMTYYEDADVS